MGLPARSSISPSVNVRVVTADCFRDAFDRPQSGRQRAVIRHLGPLHAKLHRDHRIILKHDLFARHGGKVHDDVGALPRALA